MKIYIDGGTSTWRKVVNRFGRTLKGSGAMVGAGTDESGKMLFQKFNGKITEQIEAECWALLSAVNYVIDNNIKKATILSDLKLIADQKLEEIEFKSRTYAGKYVWVAKKIAKDNGLDIKIEWVPSKENKADQYANPVSYLEKK